MKFWREHAALRMALIPSFFAAGIALLIFGWRITGQLSGLAVMLAGLVALLLALLIYNKPFETPKSEKKRGKGDLL